MSRQGKSDNRLSNLEQQFAVTMTKIDSALTELKEQREDIRRLQERQDAMQAKHEAEMHEMNKRFYEKIGSIDAKFNDVNKHINDTWRNTMIGVGGMIVALGALILTALK